MRKRKLRNPSRLLITRTSWHHAVAASASATMIRPSSHLASDASQLSVESSVLVFFPSAWLSSFALITSSSFWMSMFTGISLLLSWSCWSHSLLAFSSSLCSSPRTLLAQEVNLDQHANSLLSQLLFAAYGLLSTSLPFTRKTLYTPVTETPMFSQDTTRSQRRSTSSPSSPSLSFWSVSTPISCASARDTTTTWRKMTRRKWWKPICESEEIITSKGLRNCLEQRESLSLLYLSLISHYLRTKKWL